MAGTKGPIIEPEDKTPDEQISIRLRPELARDLRAYGQYANSSVHHIVSAALKRLFAADKEFKAFKDEHPNSVAVSSPTSEAKSRGNSSGKTQAPTASI